MLRTLTDRAHWQARLPKATVHQDMYQRTVDFKRMNVVVNSLSMSYFYRLTIEERNRMIYASIDCSEPKCMAVRGQPCKSLIQTKHSRNGLTVYPHIWRQRGFTQWRKRNPSKYRLLEDQIIAQRETETDHYETCPA